jgi:hypothetical protein
MVSTILVDPGTYGRDCRHLMAFLAEAHPPRPLWQPMHSAPTIAGPGAVGCEVAEDLSPGLSACLPRAA